MRRWLKNVDARRVGPQHAAAVAGAHERRPRIEQRVADGIDRDKIKKRADRAVHHPVARRWLPDAPASVALTVR